MLDLTSYRGRRVLVTGHTGFKGSWLCRLLCRLGAQVCGYSLLPPTDPNLFTLLGLEQEMRSEIGDVCDLPRLREVFESFRPEIVLHLAAQPIVRESYRDPFTTYQTNVMGTVCVLECVRSLDCVRSFLNVTTDKVYENKEWQWGYREIDPLDGYDPYSNSKSCSELVTHSYQKSFFSDGRVAISTMRAGNVIGGGDFAKDRILPDCLRSLECGVPLTLRNPHSTRPYQHVLEPLVAYLTLALRQMEDPSLAGWYNIGPDDVDCVTTGELVELFAASYGEGFTYEIRPDGGPHEASFLKLDSSKLKGALGYTPRFHVAEAVALTAEWMRCYLAGEDIRACTDRQIDRFFEEN